MDRPELPATQNCDHDQDSPISRRTFLNRLGQTGLTLLSLPLVLKSLGLLEQDAEGAMGTPKEVTYYRKLANLQTICEVCPLNCTHEPGGTGYCRTRNNVNGVLYNYAFNNPCILTVDEIEKMPLNHFLPASRTLSIATGGCNLRCLYCQNWEQSQARPETLRTFNFDRHKAKEITTAKNIRIIGYTYTEPVVFSEYIIDLAQHTRPGVRHVAASSVFMNPRPLQELCRHLDAMAITLKGFRDEFYRNVCGRALRPVLDSIELVQKTGIWFELINLLVPTCNDSSQELRDMCRWIRQHLGREVPLHFARFVPQYRLRNLPPTPISTMEKAREIALAENLKYVYLSNVAPHAGNNTYCGSCRALLIERLGFQILQNRMRPGGRCPQCGERIPGRW